MKDLDFEDDEYSEEDLIKLDMMYDEMQEILVNDFLQEYVAKYIQCLYKYEFLQAETTSLRRHVNSAIDTFNSASYEDVNFEKVSKILKDKYRLKIIREEPYLELKEI